MGTHTGNVITLANSIIGVSVLAMPFCFKQCGIFLAILMLLFSNITTRLACHYLMKSAILEKRKNFEMLAFRVFGPTGKLIVELGIIGFMLGTCVAYFVIIGDLGPGILGPVFGFQQPLALRPSVLIAVAVFVILPLGLLKNVDSLSAICAATIAFYFCLVLKVMGEAINHLTALDWIDKVYFWRPSGILQCIPIFSMALSCQTQLFEIFDSLPSNPLDRMNAVVKSAINMVTLFYISVGFFGYIAYCDQSFSGNLMMNFSPAVTSDVIKLGFLLSVAVSFPLVIFPCRASIHSLFFSKGYEHAHTGSAHISETRFKCITLVIVTSSLITGLLIPNIEIVLGLVGSTIGVIICVIIPGIIFTSLSMRNNNERLVAKFLVCYGLLIMVLGTYANLYATEEAVSGHTRNIPIEKDDSSMPKILNNVEIKDDTLRKINDVVELAALPELKSKLKEKKIEYVIGDKEESKIPPDSVAGKFVMATVQPVAPLESAKAPLPDEPLVKHEAKKEPPLPQEPMEQSNRNNEPLPVIALEAKKIVEKEPQTVSKLKESPAAVENLQIGDPPKAPPNLQEVKQDPPLSVKSGISSSPLDSADSKNEKKIKAGILQDTLIFQEAKRGPPSQTVHSNLTTISDDAIKQAGNANYGLDKAPEIKEVFKANIVPKKDDHVDTMQEIVKENLIEKIKEHEEAQRKLNEEGVKLLKEIKDYVNITKDSFKIVNVKTGEISDIKNSKNQVEKEANANKETLKEQDGLVMKMAKGIPLPLAVKGQQEILTNVKEKVIDTKKENEVADKHGIERDLLGNDSGLREKRDLERVMKEADNTVTIVSEINPTFVVKSQNLTLFVNQDLEIPKAIVNETGTVKSLPEMETENCVKKDDPHSKANGILVEDGKLDMLIKSPSFLSNINPVLNNPPQLLNSEVSKKSILEMPKKRDLKSVKNEDLPDYNKK